VRDAQRGYRAPKGAITYYRKTAVFFETVHRKIEATFICGVGSSEADGGERGAMLTMKPRLPADLGDAFLKRLCAGLYATGLHARQEVKAAGVKWDCVLHVGALCATSWQREKEPTAEA